MVKGLLMFFGTECVHCHEMDPLVKKLEKELKVKVKKLETWHNAKNKAIFDKHDKSVSCGGVPMFFNEKSGKGLCGAVSYASLLAWAKG